MGYEDYFKSVKPPCMAIYIYIYPCMISMMKLAWASKQA